MPRLNLNFGFTLIEALIMVGLTSTLMYGVLILIESNQRDYKRLDTKYQIMHLHNTIYDQMSDPEICRETFEGKKFFYSGGKKSKSKYDNILFIADGASKFQAGAQTASFWVYKKDDKEYFYGNHRVKITKIGISDYQPYYKPANANDNKFFSGVASFRIDYETKEQQKFSRDFKLAVELYKSTDLDEKNLPIDPSLVNTIKECHSLNGKLSGEPMHKFISCNEDDADCSFGCHGLYVLSSETELMTDAGPQKVGLCTLYPGP